jgi:hypothetical protein
VRVADLALGIAARTASIRIASYPELTGIEPCGKDRLPSLVMGAGNEFGDVIDGAVGCDPAVFAKVIDGVAAVGLAPADADQKDLVDGIWRASAAM